VIKLRSLIARLLLGKDITRLLQGYTPPRGKHNSLITGSPTNWSWGKGDHGSELDGLGDDDHTQYLNNARHDVTARHTLGSVVPHDSHSGLTGVTANQHHAQAHTLGSHSPSRIGKSRLQWAVDKLLKGAGTGFDPVEVDMPAAGATLTFPDIEVYNGNGPGPSAWVDLDLSSYVGSKKALVWIRIKTSSQQFQTYHFAFRQNGDTNEYYDSGTAAGGTQKVNKAKDIARMVVCYTDSSGIIEWKGGGAAYNVVLDLVPQIS